MHVNELKQLLVSGFFWAFTGRVMTAVFGMAVNALLARVLAPEEVGIYFLLVSLTTILSMLAMFGQQRVIVRFVAESRARGNDDIARTQVYQAFMIVLAACVPVMILCIFYGGAMMQLMFDAEILPILEYFIAALVLVRVASSMVAESCRAFHDIRNAVFLNGALVNALMVSLMLYLYVAVERSTLTLVVGLSVLAYLINTLFGGVVLRKHVEILGEGGYSDWRRMVITGGPFLITGLTIFVITQADLWIAGYALAETDVALYGAAVKLVQLILIPLMIMNAVLPSIISDLHARNEKSLMEKMLRTAAMVAGVPAIIMLCVVMLFAEDVLRIVYGEYYTSAASVLVIVGVGQAINVVAGAGMLVLMMTGMHMLVMLVNMIAGLVLITSGPVLAANYGISGIALAVAVMLILQAVAVVLVVRLRLGIWPHMGFGGLSALLTHFRKAAVGNR